MKRKLIATTLLIMLIVCQACQDNPESTPILDRSNDYLDKNHLEQNNSMATDGNTYQQNFKYDYPPIYESKSEFEKQNLTIHYAASVHFPEVSIFPVTRVVPRKFTEVDYSNLIDYFAPNSDLFYIPERSKEEWESLLIEARRGENIDGTYVQTEYSQELAAEIEKIIPLAPTEKKLIPFDFQLTNYIDGESFECLVNDENNLSYMQGVKNGNSFLYSRVDEFNLQDEEMVLMGNAIMGEAPGTQIRETIKIDDAISIAETALCDLRLNEYKLDETQKARIVTTTGKTISTGWVLYYVPEYNNLKLYNLKKTFTTKLDQLPSIVGPWKQESLELYIDDAGISVFNWTGAIEELYTELPTTDLIDFSSLMERVNNQIRYTYIRADIFVQDISLGVSLLSVPDERSQGRLVPTWYITYEVQARKDNQTKYTENMAFTAHDGGYVEPRLTIDQLTEYSIAAAQALRE